MKPVDELTYEEAAAELDSILQQIQNQSCGIDRLTELTRRAAALLDACRKRLTTTETELRDILQQMQ